VHWVYYSIHLFGQASVALSLVVSALFVLVLSLIASLSGLLYKGLSVQRNIVVKALLFSALWALMEWLRAWLFGGFPWLAIGYSQLDTAFSAYAPVLGVYGVGALLVLCSSLAVVVFCKENRRQSVISALVIMAIVFTAHTLDKVQWTVAKDNKLAIRMVQGNIEQQVKFDRNVLTHTLDLYAKMSESSKGVKPDLVIWPETAVPTVFHRVEDYLAPVVNRLQQQKTELVSGGFYIDEQDNVYNSFKQLTGEKQLYLKSHLVPFGEFMPFRFVLDALASLIVFPMSDLSAGPNTQQPLKLKGEHFAISICFEDAFGEEMRFQLPKASVLINVSNDTWFGLSSAPAQHQEIAAMRAREFARPLVRATNTGLSAFISYRGKVQENLEQFKAGFLDYRVTPREGRTPYVVLGNYPTILFFTLILGGIWWTRKKSNKKEAFNDKL
jgi:apolipoprotein N-acyltransferase